MLLITPLLAHDQNNEITAAACRLFGAHLAKPNPSDSRHAFQLIDVSFDFSSDRMLFRPQRRSPRDHGYTKTTLPWYGPYGVH